jgi:hypothetical protein
MSKKLSLAAVVVGLTAGLVLASVALGRDTHQSKTSALLQTVRAYQRARTAKDAMPARAAQAVAGHIKISQSRRILAGATTTVYLAPSADGSMLCLIALDANSQLGTGCSRPGDFFQSHGFAVLLKEQGGPTPSSVVAYGVSQSNVSRVSASTGASAAPNASGGFTVARGELRRGSTLSAKDGSGRSLQPLVLPAR